MTAALPPTVLRSVLTALMLAIFLGALDQTIVAVSLPAISAQFNDVGLLAWVISGYMVAMTIAVPIYGKLGDLYGRRRMILTGTALFTLASIACGLAQDMPQLVLARVLQGIGRALMNFAENIAHDIGYREINLYARKIVAGFYEKSGYKSSGDEFIKLTIPHIVMKKKI